MLSWNMFNPQNSCVTYKSLSPYLRGEQWCTMKLSNLPNSSEWQSLDLKSVLSSLLPVFFPCHFDIQASEVGEERKGLAVQKSERLGFEGCLLWLVGNGRCSPQTASSDMAEIRVGILKVINSQWLLAHSSYGWWAKSWAGHFWTAPWWWVDYRWDNLHFPSCEKPHTHKIGPHRNGPSVHGRAETFWSSVSQVWLGDLLFQHLTSLSPLAFLTDGLYRWQGME